MTIHNQSRKKHFGFAWIAGFIAGLSLYSFRMMMCMFNYHTSVSQTASNGATTEAKAMTKEEQQIEEMVQEKGKTAPRICPQDLDDAIDPNVPVQYHIFPGTTTTICLITLKNGFTVTGESAAVSLENFDEEIGREVAFKEARNKLWPLLGFALKERLAQ